MIEKFLKQILPQHYGLNSDDVEVPLFKSTKPFTLTDEKACAEAAQFKYKNSNFNKYTEVCSDCDKVVLAVVNNGKEITIVHFEEYILKSLKKAMEGKRRCDLLMADGDTHTKIVFCNLCCYDEQYITPNNSISMPMGKRAMAYKQMEDSLEFLLEEDALRLFILGYPRKECLFAYRSYSTTPQSVKATRGNVETNMQAMMITPSSASGQIITENTVMNHNFIFVQNKYPKEYKW